MPIRGNIALGLAIPVTRRARLTVERDLVKRQYRGEPIGNLDGGHLITLAATRTLHSAIAEGADQFIRDYAKKGYQALANPEDFIVWGPYQSRGFGLTSAKPTIAHLSAEGEDLFPNSADFIIEGKFLATQGRIPA